MKRALLATLLLLLARAAPAQDAEEKKEAPADFKENLFSFDPIDLSTGAREQSIEITIHRWGTVTGAQEFVVSVASKPSFIEEAKWVGDSRLVFEPDETEKQTKLVLTVAKAGRGEGDLVIVIRCEKGEIEPRERRFNLPLTFGRARGVAKVFALQSGAPPRFKPEDMHTHIDREARPLYVYDRLALFLTPAVDLRKKPLEFHWKVTGPNGRVWFDGLYAPGDNLHEGGMELVANEAPAMLGAELVRSFRTTYNEGPRKESWPRGAYVVASAPEAYSGIEMLGVKHRGPGEYVEQASVELTNATLHFAGFVAERVRGFRLDGLPMCYDGTLDFAAPRVEGTTVTLRGDAAWHKVITRHERGRAVRAPDARTQRASARLRLVFPAKIDPGASKHGAVECELTLPDEGEGTGSERPFRFTAAVLQLVPVSGRRPERDLAVGDKIPDAFGVASLRKEDKPSEAYDIMGGRGVQIAPGKRRRVDWSHILFGSECGVPERSFPYHLRDTETVFYAPVRLAFPTQHDEPVTIEQIGFAVYRPRPSGGPGPEPVGGPDDVAADREDGGDGTDEGGDPLQGPGADEDEDPGGDTTDTDRGGGGADDGGGGGEDDGGGGGADDGGGDRPDSRVDPDRLDPKNPDIAALIREWIGVAEPPPNAEVGARLRYNEWGVMVGQTPTAVITAVGKPDDVRGRTSEEYLWSLRKKLDSVNHCTLEEYVVLRLEGRGIGGCGGRYRRRERIKIPTLEGATRPEAERALAANGFVPRFERGDPAPAPQQENTVQSQSPAPGTEVRAGAEVRVRLFTRREPVTAGGRPYYVVLRFATPTPKQKPPPGTKAKDHFSKLTVRDVEFVTKDDQVQFFLIDRQATARYPRAKFSRGARVALPVALDGLDKKKNQRFRFKGALLAEVVGTFDDMGTMFRANPKMGEGYRKAQRKGETPHIGFDRPDGTLRGTTDDAKRRIAYGLGPIEMGWSDEMKRKNLELYTQIFALLDCFVATAVYGERDNHQLQVLRRFRDEVLQRSEAGRRLIAAYYCHGPAIALRVYLRPGAAAELRPRFDRLVAELERLDWNDPYVRTYLNLLVRGLDWGVAHLYPPPKPPAYGSPSR